MKKKVLNFPFLSLGFFPVVLLITLLMVACGPGSGLKTIDKPGETRGANALAETGFKNADLAESSAATRLGKTAGLRARYSLIGNHETNRSRIGQSLRADNPATSDEEILTISN